MSKPYLLIPTNCRYLINEKCNNKWGLTNILNNNNNKTNPPIPNHQSDHQSFNLIDETEDENEEKPIPTPTSKKSNRGARLKAKAKKKPKIPNHKSKYGFEPKETLS
uniref:Uncharacterized protein n=1 Tax=Tanacetum cinerariifolium TaxID=118510 RepID=A0A6L2NZJ3_TANCI|nr:hypothetical protein [Tanacetum cinerariifolium]